MLSHITQQAAAFLLLPIRSYRSEGKAFKVYRANSHRTCRVPYIGLVFFNEVGWETTYLVTFVHTYSSYIAPVFVSRSSGSEIKVACNRFH